MILKKIKILGKFEERSTTKLRTIKTGRHADRSIDYYFYIEHGKRVFITDEEFTNRWTKYN